MRGLQKQQTILTLKAQIAALEARPLLAPYFAAISNHDTTPLPSSPARGEDGRGVSPTSQAIGGRDVGWERDAPPPQMPPAPAGLLHEVFTDFPRNAGAALGFALGQARGLLGAERLAVFYLQLQGEAQEVGLPYGPGLQSFGFDPGRLVFGRLETIGDLLWAAEEAVACRAVAAVVADVASHPKALDFTASRRLSLRAAAAGTSIFMLRYGQGREASAAQLRWRVAPEVSGEAPFDANAPGSPRWRVSLEKGRLGISATEFLLDWTENGFVWLQGDRRAELAGSGSPRPAAPGALPAALGDRLPQTG